MTDETIELAVEVPLELKQAVEQAATARGVSVSKLLEDALRRFLLDRGYIDDEPGG